MPIPNQALILVADGRKTLFLRNHGDAAQLDLRTETHDERDDRKDRELKSDAPGLRAKLRLRPARARRNRLSPAGQGPLAKDTADILNRRALAGDYDALAVVAPPKTLGELRKHFHKETEKRLVATFNKEMTDRPLADIEDLLAGEAAPPA